ncbi:MAG: penicillin-binding protein 2 [Rickettsiales bacterium]|jgi:penicillin-binding protein 2|nr:penicillin-binding protein 2 [Rickettsiales bacterium]
MIDRELGNIFSRRAFITLAAGGAALGLVFLRLVQLQIFGAGRYRKLAENNSLKIRPIMPPRGIIYDRGRDMLATNLVSYRAYIVPREVLNIEEIISLLHVRFRLSKPRINAIERQYSRNRRTYTPIFVKENISWKEMSELRINRNIPGFFIEQGSFRIYPNGKIAAHVVGYVGTVSESDIKRRFDPMMGVQYFKIGKAGIERRFDSVLRGTAGQNIQVVNAVGKVIKDEEKTIEPVPGENIKLNLSLKVQKILEESMEAYPVCSGVVMDIETGNVLAMASHPSFEPGAFQEDGGEYFEKLKANPHKPFMNNAIEGAYPPGSTFKIVVAMAALEGGAMTPGERFYCDGSWTYGNHKYHCWEKKGHGWQNMLDAIAHSCDVYFYQVALKIGIDAIKNMATKLGLGQVLQNDLLGETPGVIPDRRWKEKNVGASWVHGDTIISGIGQGFVLVTPLQLCTMLCRLVSNSRVVPKIVDHSEKGGFEELGLRRANIGTVMKGLENVVKKGGTAGFAAINVNGQSFGGKTGTSQVRRITEQERDTRVRTNDELPWHLRNHGLFVGFAPTENPRYAMSMVTEHSGGSGNAANIVSAVFRKLLKGEGE